MVTSIPPDERLLDLVIALLNTPTRMTKDDVRHTVAGYSDAPSPDAFERMFERDKETLRELGVPLLTVTDQAHGDDVGYRIDLDAWSLPPVDLTAAELGVLALAGQVWQDAALRQDAARAVAKLRAVADGAADDLAAGVTARAHTGGSALAPLLDAVHQGRPVRFSYRAASTGEVRPRTVEPWRLAARRGGWMLVGHDRDRDAVRSFRLARIQGPVKFVGGPGEVVPPTAEQLATADRNWSGRVGGTAVLGVLPGRASALRIRSDDAADTTAWGPCPEGRDLVAVSYQAVWELAEEIVGYGDAVVVLGPPDVRAAVVSMLRAAARWEGGVSDG